jgi:cobalt-precorrin-5B (C1)-methyltransferase
MPAAHNVMRTGGETTRMPSRKKKKLRPGFTTGTAAAAAAKAATIMLLEERPPDRVEVLLLTGDPISIPVRNCRRSDRGEASCTVVKDAGDDPDVTHRAVIGARVIQRSAQGEALGGPRIRIRGGPGVGQVTKPGLEVPPGQPAINPGPRRMITREVEAVLDRHRTAHGLDVEIYVPDGERLAQKTLNARLGIIGGISILGTTGIVKPLSHEAYTATIAAAVSVARAAGLERLILSTGRRSERYAQALLPAMPEEAFVQIGDYFKSSLQLAARQGFRRIGLAVFFGKALKMALGHAHTHAAKSRLSLEQLAQWALDEGHPACAEPIRTANTAREAFGWIRSHCPELFAHVARRVVRAGLEATGNAVHIQAILFDYDGNVQFDSDRN